MAIFSPMLAGVLVLGTVTTADLPAQETCSEMHPYITGGDAAVTHI